VIVAVDECDQSEAESGHDQDQCGGVHTLILPIAVRVRLDGNAQYLNYSINIIKSQYIMLNL
jgi:hypothetical protein